MSYQYMMVIFVPFLMKVFVFSFFYPIGFRIGCALVYTSFESNSELNSFCIDHGINKECLWKEIYHQHPSWTFLLSLENFSSKTLSTPSDHPATAFIHTYTDSLSQHHMFQTVTNDVHWPLAPSNQNCFWGTKNIDEVIDDKNEYQEVSMDQDVERNEFIESIIQHKSNWKVVLILDTREVIDSLLLIFHRC